MTESNSSPAPAVPLTASSAAAPARTAGDHEDMVPAATSSRLAAPVVAEASAVGGASADLVGPLGPEGRSTPPVAVEGDTPDSFGDSATVVEAALALVPARPSPPADSVAARLRFSTVEAKILTLAQEFSDARGRLTVEAIDATEYTADAITRALADPTTPAIPLDQAVLRSEVAAAVARIDVSSDLCSLVRQTIADPGHPDLIRQHLRLIDRLYTAIQELVKVVQAEEHRRVAVSSKVKTLRSQIGGDHSSPPLGLDPPTNPVVEVASEVSGLRSELQAAQQEIQRLRSEIAAHPRPSVKVSGPRSDSRIPPLAPPGGSLQIADFSNPVFDDLHRLYRVEAQRAASEHQAKIREYDSTVEAATRAISDQKAEIAAVRAACEARIAELQRAHRVEVDILAGDRSGFLKAMYAAIAVMAMQIHDTPSVPSISESFVSDFPPDIRELLSNVVRAFAPTTVVSGSQIQDAAASGPQRRRSKMAAGSPLRSSAGTGHDLRRAASNAAAINAALASEDDAIDLTRSEASDLEIKTETRGGRSSTKKPTSAKRRSSIPASRSQLEDTPSLPPAKKTKRSAQAPRSLPVCDLSSARASLNDLPPIPDDLTLSIEDRLAPAIKNRWPFLSPDRDPSVAGPYSAERLSSLIDERIPFYSHTILSYQRYSSVANSNQLPTLTKLQYERFLKTKPWDTLASMLPQAPTTFSLDRCDPALVAFWDRLLGFVRANIQWFWERTHYLIVAGDGAEQRKQRHSHMRVPYLEVLADAAKLIRRGIADVDLLLEPAMLRYVHTPIPLFITDASPDAIAACVSKVEARWPERTYHLACPELHASSYPAISDRIAGKFDAELGSDTSDL